MPLLGAIGNASKYSFRGTYDNYPFDIDFGNLEDVEPGKIYTTSFKLIDDINYKVPLSISGDGEYYIGNISFDRTFDNNITSFDQTPTTFDSDFPELDYSTQPTYVRNGDIISLRVIGIPPKKVEESIALIIRTGSQIPISLLSQINILLRSGPYSFNPNNNLIIDNRDAQGSIIPTEYYGKTYTTNVTIGKKEFVWTVKTRTASLPQNFAFTPSVNVPLNSEIISNPYVVSGLSQNFTYTVSIITTLGNPFLSVDSQPFTKSAQIRNGSSIRIKALSSAITDSPIDVGVKIAVDNSELSTITYWKLTTIDNVPTNLSAFQNINDAEFGVDILSNKVKIEGLSNNIDFNVSVNTGFLSVNGRQFTVKDTIRNGDELQLKIKSPPEWNSESSVTVTIENTSYTWTVKTRQIKPLVDGLHQNLLLAYPLEYYSAESYNGIPNKKPKEFSKEIKALSGEVGKDTVTTLVTSDLEYQDFQNKLSKDLRVSKYYLHSYQVETTNITPARQGELSYFTATTDSSLQLRTGEFTIEFWFRTSSFDFSGTPGISVIRPPYFDTRKDEDFVPIVYIKGDNWVTNDINYKRGVLLGYVDRGTGQPKTLIETSRQVFKENVWHLVSIIRSSINDYQIYVDGVLINAISIALQSGNTSNDFTGYNYQFFRTDGRVKLYNQNTYFQDLRIYNKARILSTLSYDYTRINSVLEKYSLKTDDVLTYVNPLSDLYTDSLGRVLILSCNTPGKDPRTLTKTESKVLPNTDTCIDDTRWKTILNLAQNDTSLDGYRLTIQDTNSNIITKATNKNIQKLLNSNRLPLRESLTDWKSSNEALNTVNKIDVSGSDGSFVTIDFSNLSTYSDFKPNVVYTLTSYANLNVKIYAVGAKGSGSDGGSGGSARGKFTFISGKKYKLTVGSTTGGGASSSGIYGASSGGGYTGFFEEDIAHSNSILIAGGGGGGGVRGGSNLGGGAGGGASGGNGVGNYKGGGGTQTSGGSAGQGGRPGGPLTGGSGFTGGGSGYYGGGGGGSFFGVYNESGGGGGSGYLHPTLITEGDFSSANSAGGGNSSVPSGSFKIEYLQNNSSLVGIILAWDDNDGFNGSNLDYSGLKWTSSSEVVSYTFTSAFSYFNDSSNSPFLSSVPFTRAINTARWWILPPGVPDFS